MHRVHTTKEATFSGFPLHVFHEEEKGPPLMIIHSSWSIRESKKGAKVERLNKRFHFYKFKKKVYFYPMPTPVLQLTWS